MGTPSYPNSTEDLGYTKNMLSSVLLWIFVHKNISPPHIICQTTEGREKGVALKVPPYNQIIPKKKKNLLLISLKQCNSKLLRPEVFQTKQKNVALGGSRELDLLHQTASHTIHEREESRSGGTCGLCLVTWGL